MGFHLDTSGDVTTLLLRDLTKKQGQRQTGSTHRPKAAAARGVLSPAAKLQLWMPVKGAHSRFGWKAQREHNFTWQIPIPGAQQEKFNSFKLSAGAGCNTLPVLGHHQQAGHFQHKARGRSDLKPTCTGSQESGVVGSISRSRTAAEKQHKVTTQL